MATRSDAPLYTLTLPGFLATVPRGACGHVVCLHRERCLLTARPNQ